MTSEAQTLIQKINSNRESLMDVQYKIARIIKIDKPPEIPDFYHEITLDVCNSLTNFCSQQRVLLTSLENLIKSMDK